jgi:ABC-type branched-subunit amino acid transport system substrate-binding protein/serine/threonine protein kinase
MRCPRCSFEGEPVDGACVQCGYRRVSVSDSLRTGGTSESGMRTPSASLRSPSDILRSPSIPLRSLSGPLRSPSVPLRSLTGPSRPLSLYTAKRGDTLNQGRYRLVDQLILPDNQQGQGAAWLAIDSAAGQTQVVIREVIVPPEEQENKKQVVRQVALRLSEAAQHSGFPKVLDVFNELDNYFIVFQHIEGESLASLLRRQGGALPERTVAEYGRQLCEMLTVLARQQPPIVHGAISPETVIVSPDRSRVHLVHLPLFPLKESPGTGSTAGYKAPEQSRGICDPSSDLYSVAATLHHAVTGFDPRERIAFFYPPARRLNPVVSQQMETILAQELRLSAPQRYARAVDMQGDLAALLARPVPESERRLPAVVTDPLKMDIAEIRRQSLRRSRSQMGIFAAVCLLVLMVILAVSIYPTLKIPTGASAPTPNSTATMAALTSALESEWQAEAPLYQTKGIGLSDGRYVFDTYPGHAASEINYKKQAAQALLKGDMGTALSEYSLAVTNDKTDAETRIYYEDLQIETQNDPYVTIVLGLPLDNDSADLAISRPDLQAAFAFQNLVNTQNPSPLPGGVKLRILIANSGSDNVNNSGSDNGDVAAVAQFIAKRVQIGNLDHIVGVVGWPKSKESLNAYSVLTSAKIPMITQTASSVALDGVSPYFFRVNPTDAEQGKAQAQLAYQTLGARTVLVLRDHNDPYSQSLADAFTATFRQLGGQVSGTQADYFTEAQTTVEQFRQAAVQDAIKNHVDLIFLPGFDVDGIRLARALGEEEGMLGWSSYLAHLKILGGDGLDTGLILGNGVGPDATLAQTFPQDMRRLLFTSFANTSEGGPQMQNFLNNWSKLYGVASASNPNPPLPINTALMVYDAFGVFTYAMSQVRGPLTGESLRNALAALGTGNIRPYQGVSGQISFGSDGDPINKSLVLLEVVAGPNGQNELKSLGLSGKSS